MTSARFDDLRPDRRRSFRLSGFVEEFAARTPAEVRGVLERAADAVGCGRWVAGWVSYEAAPALDAHAVVLILDRLGVGRHTGYGVPEGFDGAALFP